LDSLKRYISDIKSGAIPSCIYVKNAVKRFEKDLKNSKFDFREDRVREVLDCIAQLKHFAGEHSGKNFIAQPWQVFITANIYGFYLAGTEQRRFNDAYIEIARKNGKTAYFGSGLGIYHLIGDGEDAGEILIAANSKEQAHICFDLTKGFCKTFDPAQSYLRAYRSDIKFPETNSFIKVLAADSCKLDGYNSSYGLIDEYHSAPDSKVKDVIESSMAMRFNPILMVITTAGFNKDSVCYKMRTNAVEVISGVKEEDSLFSIIFTIDEEDDWKDEKNWVKSNPNLDITVKRSFLRKQVIKATNNPSEEVGIKTKNFNVWCDTEQVWIPDEYILNATGKIEFSAFKGEECFVGVDLGSTQDMTAVSYEFFKEGKKYFILKYYLPQESLNTAPNREMYKNWVRMGYLTITPGNVTDYDYITKDIIEASNVVSIFKINYDKWNSVQWAIDCTEIGLPLEPFSQSIGNFNAPTKELERSILSGDVIIDDNPITRFCFRNVVMRQDYNANVKPDKSKAIQKIDGVIAMIQSDAACVQRNENVYSGNIY
jgi:phage terminase large subunit-like protein